MTTGSASIIINRPPAEAWAAIADITRMGEWSPECTGGRWVGGATGPAVGAKFKGDNVAKVAGRTVKKWTTTSEVTACEPGSSFEFTAEGYTTWRYTFEPAAGPGGTGPNGSDATKVTETFAYEAKGFMGFVYEKLLRRSRMMTKGMQRTLERVKATLEEVAGLT
ncbi:MAG: SRPBCC family protein [Actinomycetota bacterium]|nr:SRPBCC family protein [Actinomycetota bacterium]